VKAKVGLPALLLAIGGCGLGTSPAQHYLEDVTRHAILPLHRQFVGGTEAFAARAETFCADPTPAAYDDARAAWLRAMADWKRLETVRFGPVTNDNQNWKIQFWPDKSNLVGNQIGDLLDGDEALTPERLERASVVVQGLSAAEFLLFDEEGGTFARYVAARSGDAARRCRLLERIATHTVGVAVRLEHAWSPEGGDFAARLTAPGPGNADFADENAALAAVVDGILATLEVTKDNRIAEPLGLRNRAGFPQPYATEAWRSRRSLELIAAAVGGARLLYYGGDDAATRYGVGDLLRDSDAGAIADTIDRAFDAVAEAMPGNLVLFDAVNDERAAVEFEKLHAALAALTDAIETEVPAALGITLGFNRNDGD
jgi:hypothetical protein